MGILYNIVLAEVYIPILNTIYLQFAHDTPGCCCCKSYYICAKIPVLLVKNYRPQASYSLRSLSRSKGDRLLANRVELITLLRGQGAYDEDYPEN